MISYRRFKFVSLNRWLPYLLSTVIPLFFLILWHSENTLLPTDDGANFWENGHLIYLEYREHGFLDGVVAAYYVRGFRPIIFPAFIAFFLTISNGDISLAFPLTMCFSFFLFLHFAYLLMKLFISPWKAASGTLFISTIPWIVRFSHILYSEMLLMALALASAYYLIKSDCFLNFKSSLLAGFFIGLGFCMRPVVFLLNFFIPLILIVTFSRKRGKISPFDIEAAIYIFGVTCLILFISMVPSITFPYKFNILLCLLLLIIICTIVLIFKKRSKIHYPFFIAFALANFIGSIWWLRGMRKLYDWVYETSFGNLNRLYSGIGEMGFLQGLGHFFSHLGGFPLLITSLVAVTAVIGTWRKRKEFIPLLLLSLIPIFMILPYIIVHSFSPGGDNRRVFIGFTLLLVAAFTISVHPAFILQKTRTTIILLFTMTQLFTVSLSNTGAEGLKITPLTGPVDLPYIGGDPSLKVYEKLKEIPELTGSTVASMFAQDLPREAKTFDTYTLRALTVIDGDKFSLAYPTIFTSLTEGYLTLFSHYDYVLLNVPEKIDFPLNNPYLKLSDDILQKWKDNRLDEVMLREIKQFSIDRRDIILLKVEVNKKA